MDESKPDRSSDKGAEAPNACKKGKEETETLVNNEKRPLRIRQTRGSRDDIDVNTPIRDVKGPKVFDRVKEEFEAIRIAIQQRKEDKSQDSPSSVKRDAAFKETKKQSSLTDHRGSPSHRRETHGRGEDIDPDTPIGEFKGPNIFHRAKEEFEAIVDTIQSKRESDRDAPSPKKQSSTAADNRGSPSYRRETHGRGEAFDADTPASEFKGPNVFHRAKEEIEAIVDTIQSKKESDRDAASPKKDGFRASISKKLQRNRNRD